jgi:hypothetical protein
MVNVRDENGVMAAAHCASSFNLSERDLTVTTLRAGGQRSQTALCFYLKWV